MRNMKVFVSSTYKDLKEYREAARDAIIGQEQIPIMMEYIIPEGNPPIKECYKKIKESDLFIGIYAYHYGFIHPKAKISITEQEFRYARKKGKRIYCFILHSDKKNEWPDEFKIKEDLPQLKNFRGEILIETYVKFFKYPADLGRLVTEVLSKVPPPELSSQEALKEARKETKNINTTKKLKIIDDLVVENENNRLNDEALKSTTKLIASGFKTYDPSISSKFIYHTKNFLLSNIRINEFVVVANEFTQKIRTKNLFRNKKLFIALILSFLIGLSMSYLSYRYNWFGARSKYLAGKNADPMDVVNWLANEKVKDNIQFDDFSSPGTVRAIAALSFAYELDPDNPRLKSSLEQLIRSSRIITRPQNISPDLLQNNMKILEEIHRQVPYPPLITEADMLKVRWNLIYLQQQMMDSTISDQKLLNEYKDLWKNYNDKIDTVLVQGKIENLSESVKLYENLKTFTDSDTATITQQIIKLQNFVKSHRASPEKTYAKKEMQRIRDLTENYASLTGKDKFITCRGVQNRAPQGRSNKFAPGNIWAWAQVRAPRSESITFKWYAKGELYHSKSYDVQRNLGDGYRIHTAKSYSADFKGKNEVRLYNSQNVLIGRRVFTIGN